jgi:hypothetical protein
MCGQNMVSMWYGYRKADLITKTCGHILSGHGLSGHSLSGHSLSGHSLSGHGLSGHGLRGHILSDHSQAKWPLSSVIMV